MEERIAGWGAFGTPECAVLSLIITVSLDMPGESSCQQYAGVQWFVLLRRHAEMVAEDRILFDVFRKHCKVVPFKMVLQN